MPQFWETSSVHNNMSIKMSTEHCIDLAAQVAGQNIYAIISLGNALHIGQRYLRAENHCSQSFYDSECH